MYSDRKNMVFIMILALVLFFVYKTVQLSMGLDGRDLKSSAKCVEQGLDECE